MNMRRITLPLDGVTKGLDIDKPLVLMNEETWDAVKAILTEEQNDALKAQHPEANVLPLTINTEE